MYIKHNEQMIPELLGIFIGKYFHFRRDYFTFIFICLLLLAFVLRRLFLGIFIKVIISWCFFIVPCVIVVCFLWSSFRKIFFGVKSKKVCRHVIIFVNIFDQNSLTFILIVSFMLKCTKRLIVKFKIWFFMLSFIYCIFP